MSLRVNYERGEFEMSTNSKNVIRNAYMMNFTKKKKHRYILTEKGSDLDTYFQDNITKINDSINVAIQELSIKIVDRQLPFIIIEKIPINLESFDEKYSDDDKSRRIRGLIRDVKTEKGLVKRIENLLSKTDHNISHAIELFAHTSYNELTFSNNHFDAKVLLDETGLKNIFTDIFLDASMFNSYSFLKKMSKKEKREFGIKKLQFYKDHNLPCFYIFDNEDEDKVLYYSLAFSCRKSMDEFNYDEYIKLWNEFISEYYPDKRHIEKSVIEQLDQYIDPEQLDKEYIKNKIMKKDEGAYLVLRINRNRTTKMRDRIIVYFGGDSYHEGKIKIVPISEYYKIKDMLVNLDVAAFKVVRVKRKK